MPIRDPERRRSYFRAYRPEYRARQKAEKKRVALYGTTKRAKTRPDQLFPYPLVTCAQVLEAYALLFAGVGE